MCVQVSNYMVQNDTGVENCRVQMAKWDTYIISNSVSRRVCSTLFSIWAEKGKKVNSLNCWRSSSEPWIHGGHLGSSPRPASQDSAAWVCGWQPGCVLGWELAYSFLIVWSHVNFSLVGPSVLLGHMLLLNHLPFLSKDIQVHSEHLQMGSLWPSILVQGDFCGCISSREEKQDLRSARWFYGTRGASARSGKLRLAVMVVVTSYVNRQDRAMPYCGKTASCRHAYSAR